MGVDVLSGDGDITTTNSALQVKISDEGSVGEEDE
jgi:hypothetical protein